MTKLLYFFPVIIGCGSADADFSGSRVAVPTDGAVGGAGGAGGVGGASSGGIASDSGSRPFAPGVDVNRCESRCESPSGATWLGVTCDTDVDCCYSSLFCEFQANTTNGPLYACRQRADCTSDRDCPCNLVCSTYERRSEFPSASLGKCVYPP